MGRLIDAEAFERTVMFGDAEDMQDVIYALRDYQTAYDPYKVVKQLEDYANEEMHYYKGTPYEKCIEVCIGKAIEIVKGGGVDAKTDF